MWQLHGEDVGKKYHREEDGAEGVDYYGQVRQLVVGVEEQEDEDQAKQALAEERVASHDVQDGHQYLQDGQYFDDEHVLGRLLGGRDDLGSAAPSHCMAI